MGEWQSSNIGIVALSSADISAHIDTSHGRDLRMSPDGTTLFVLMAADDYIKQFTLSTPYDLSTLSYANKSFDLTSQISTADSMELSADGTKLYVADYFPRVTFQYTLTTGWDLSTCSYSGNTGTPNDGAPPAGINISSDGTRFFNAGLYDGNPIYQHDLATAWDISTIGTYTKSYDPEHYKNKFIFNATGMQFYLLHSPYIYTFNLASAWDIGSVAARADYFTMNTTAYGSPDALCVPYSNDSYVYLFENGTSVLTQFSNGFAPPYSPNEVRRNNQYKNINPYPILGGV